VFTDCHNYVKIPVFLHHPCPLYSCRKAERSWESVRPLLLYRLIWVRKLISSSKVPSRRPPFSAISAHLLKRCFVKCPGRAPVIQFAMLSSIGNKLYQKLQKCRFTASSWHTNWQPQDDWFTPTRSRDFNDRMSKEMSTCKHQATKHSSWWYTYSLANLPAALHIIIMLASNVPINVLTLASSPGHSHVFNATRRKVRGPGMQSHMHVVIMHHTTTAKRSLREAARYQVQNLKGGFVSTLKAR
jgi:hypothetical protein